VVEVAEVVGAEVRGAEVMGFSAVWAKEATGASIAIITMAIAEIIERLACRGRIAAPP
jgi:hypothetical protein